MSDDREFWDDQQSDDLAGSDDASDQADVNSEDAFPLLSADDFDDELEALAVYATEDDPDDENAEALADTADDIRDDLDIDETDDVDDLDAAAYDTPGEFDEFNVDDEVLVVAAAVTTGDSADDYAVDPDGEVVAVPAVDDEGRLRQPRAGRFRRMVHNQLGMLPLALLLIALGGYLLARGQDVSGLPDLDDGVLAVISVVTVGFGVVFHALLSGRRERGLLFVGLWILSMTGLIAALVYGIDDHPDASKWWPLVLWSTALALLLTYLIERAHDARLIFLAITAFVAGLAAYLVSGEYINEDVLQDVADYWPLLLTVVGVGLLPLVFHRRAE